MLFTTFFENQKNIKTKTNQAQKMGKGKFWKLTPLKFMPNGIASCAL
jgi:hypothetical protein